MAFGYKVPGFNLWCRVWYVFGTDHLVDASRYYQGPYYSPCAQTGDVGTAGTSQISLPKNSYVRSARNTFRGRGDIIQVGGNEMYYWKIDYTEIIGAGYPNEYVKLKVSQGFDESWPGGDNLWMGQVWPTLVPPDGYTPLGIYPGVDYWQTPTEIENHPPP